MDASLKEGCEGGKTKAVGDWEIKVNFYLILWEKHQTFGKQKGKLPNGWKLRLCDDSVE